MSKSAPWPGSYCRGGRGEVCGRYTSDDTTERWMVVHVDDADDDQFWCEECWSKRDPADREPVWQVGSPVPAKPFAGLWVRAIGPGWTE
jgi:hypothetical protein